MAIHIHVHKKVRDAAKYISDVTIKLPNGKLAPQGTVFYKVGPNLYRPYYAKTGELDVRIPVDKFTIEDRKAKDGRGDPIPMSSTVRQELVRFKNVAKENQCSTRFTNYVEQQISNVYNKSSEGKRRGGFTETTESLQGLAMDMLKSYIRQAKESGSRI